MLVISAFGIIYPLLQREIFDNGIMMNDLDVVFRYTALILGIFVVEQFLSFLQFIHYEYINRQIPYELMHKAVDHSINLKVSYHKDNNFMKTIQNVYMDIGNIAQIANANLLQAFVSLFKIIGGMIGLILIDWRLTLFILVIIPLELIIKQLISFKRSKYMTMLMKANEKFSIWLGETFMNVEIIKLWNLQNRRRKEFNTLQKDMMKVETQMEYLDNYSALSSQVLSMIFTHGLNVLGAILILGDELTIGGLFAFTAYSMFVMQPISLLADIAYRFSSSMPAFERFLNYFDHETEDFEGVHLESTCRIEELSFEGVAFGYSDENVVLKEITFSVSKGEKVAFVGVNGSGKTSIVNLILRFLEPDTGEIKLNGRNVQSIALNNYRDLFSVMNQNVSLFEGSIRSNVDILGNLSKDQIHEYLDLATATKFVEQLSNGIDTHIGYYGSKLSGGERQKISLARAFSKKGQILILDEATASFDLKAENEFDRYIAENEFYEIVIVVSHRKNILKKLDKIFIIDHGVIVDSGTFEDLMIRNDYFNTILEQKKEELG